MRTDLFDFELPEDRIALYPAEPRDSARMLVVSPAGAQVCADKTVLDLPDFLRAGDAIVVNDTRVIPAALTGTRTRDGAVSKIEVNLIRSLGDNRWLSFARPARRLRAGDHITFTSSTNQRGHSLAATVESKHEGGEITLAFKSGDQELLASLQKYGEMPLPPYIASKRQTLPEDRNTYQTIYARVDGAIAAPTAGFHITERLMSALRDRGISILSVTLHVGAGTFRPVKAAETSDHVMHAEWCTLDAPTAGKLNCVRQSGGRILAIGTTSLRVLESAAKGDGTLEPFTGETDIFITPGYRFKGTDLLLTNFHLPRSTLFMLVSAFSGLHVMHQAYAHAVASGYRFYSYGDACLLYPGEEP